MRHCLIRNGLHLSLAGWSALALIGCSDGAATVSDGDGASVHTGSETLVLGARGSGVVELHAYLKQFGYFPNQQLADRYPAWRPLVSTPPADDQLFDEHTEEAVRLLQLNANLPSTGIVDAATRELLAGGRCGVPDGIAPLDPTSKFDPTWYEWTHTNLTWKLRNQDNDPGEPTFADLKWVIGQAFATWSAETNLTFTEQVSGTVNIELEFGPIDGTGTIAGQASYPYNDRSLVTFDSGDSWSVAASTPAGRFDVQSVAAHEIGHALGLAHSGLDDALMNPFAPANNNNRVPRLDDKVGISVMYDTLTGGGAGRDVGVGANGAVWKIGSNALGDGYQVYKQNSSGGWDATDGGAVRVAVEPNGTPWVVTAGGWIYRRMTSSPSGNGLWQGMPGQARDIGIGADGTVYVVGWQWPDAAIYRWTGTTWDNTGMAGFRVAASATGRAWVLNSYGSVYRSMDSTPNAYTWEWLPMPVGAVSVKDIGVGEGEIGWVLYDDEQYIWGAVWQEQPFVSYTNGDTAAEGRWNWLYVPWIGSNYSAGGGAACDPSIAVGPGSRPFFTLCSNILLMSAK